MNNIERKKLNELRKLVLAKVSYSRFNHTIAVEQQAVLLAKIHGCSEFKAATAAILHDLTKEMKPNDQLAIISKSELNFDSDELVSPPLWHSVAAAAYAQDNLGIKDKDVINAIHYHTSGRAEMSLLEKVILVADTTSADRNYFGVAELRNLAETSLERVIFECSKTNIINLARKKRHISCNTIETYRYYLEQLALQPSLVSISSEMAG